MEADDLLVRRLARASGLRRDEVRRFVRIDLVAVGEGPSHAVLLRRLRRVRRLRQDLGLSLDAVVIIVRLLDRIEELEGTSSRRTAVRIIDEPPV
jgi:hypothetical protein